ncbi:hypothetical protein O181_041915 [Austropuccinia psidii MF-1]|uniref:Uncharacterized protein n=1 Tax=Austropuccinia psidii MF-1 TaxID=1389203 RepID=A0A9Q3DFQ9_9BASI|nr:hypothetical protein [Austropuccinia psidii MF-1]
MSSNAMGGSPSTFHRENSGSSSQTPPTEGDSIVNSDEEKHESIHTDSTGQKSIFLKDLQRLGIEDAAAQNAIVGVEFSIQQEEDQQRARNNTRILQGRNHRITRLVTKNDLPSQEYTESVHLQEFIYFLMGISPSVDHFPPSPTNDEEEFHIHWVKTQAKHIKTHLETFEYGLRAHPIHELKILVKQEITSISQQLQPPKLIPSHDFLNNKIKVSIVEKHACEKECQLSNLTSISQRLQPPEYKLSHYVLNNKISIVENLTCEKEFQLVGLKSITFQWGTSFNNCTWNAAIANIICKHFFNWSQTQPSLNINNPDKLNLLIECWVNGRGKEMKKLSKLGQAAEEVTAAYFKIAHKLFPQNNNFSAIYTDIKATSDVEDNSDW